MKSSGFLLGFFLLSIPVMTLPGCSVFKPSGVAPRTFVLTALPAPAEASATGSSVRTLGIGYVKLPEFLMAKPMAMRQGPHEIVYLENARWAERLDRGLQRVIAANLTLLLPSLQVRLSAWRGEDVSAELHVSIEEFSVDRRGECVLTASWRIAWAGDREETQASRFHATLQGQAPDLDPDAAVQAMSMLVADLSRSVAQTLLSSAR